MTEETIEEKIANADIDEKIRYAYLVRSKEIDIVGLWSAYTEALEEAKRHMKDQGVKTYEVEKINDEFTHIKPIEYDTYEEAHITRHIIR